ncbi:MAG: lytic transglycosylase domain-containing protein, partial [Acidimicrobiia bacterium]
MTPAAKAGAVCLALSPVGVAVLVTMMVAVAIGGVPQGVTGAVIAGVDPTVLAAYTAAADRVGEDVPGCAVPWSLIAAVGSVESNHAAGRTIAATGEVTPPIIGIPLDGSRGTARITDTDGGRYDGDTAFDRAVGPMQFIPSTWATAGIDGNGDGIRDPNNIFDATRATAAYLCRAVPGSSLTSDADQ